MAGEWDPELFTTKSWLQTQPKLVVPGSYHFIRSLVSLVEKFGGSQFSVTKGTNWHLQFSRGQGLTRPWRDRKYFRPSKSKHGLYRLRLGTLLGHMGEACTLTLAQRCIFSVQGCQADSYTKRKKKKQKKQGEGAGRIMPHSDV